jgi:hypothetical protein
MADLNDKKNHWTRNLFTAKLMFFQYKTEQLASYHYTQIITSATYTKSGCFSLLPDYTYIHSDNNISHIYKNRLLLFTTKPVFVYVTDVII